MNILKKLSNNIRLLCVQRTINKYRIYGQKKVKLNRKSLSSNPIMKVLRVKINGVTNGMMLVTQKQTRLDVVYVDLIWINEKGRTIIEPGTGESVFYQTMYDLFLRWYEEFTMFKKTLVLTERNTFKNISPKIAITVNISKETQIESYRHILTLYGFRVDPDLTLKEVEFHRPYREKETITNVIYSRII